MEQEERERILAAGGNPELVFRQRRMEEEARAKQEKAAEMAQQQVRAIAERIRQEEQRLKKEKVKSQVMW